MSHLYTSEALLAYVSLTVVGVVLVLLIVEHFERRLARRVSDANREVVKDIAVLHGEAKTLVELTRLGAVGAAPPQHPSPAPQPQPQPAVDVGEQLREVNAQLRELTRLITAWPPVQGPQATAAPPVVQAPVATPPQPSQPTVTPAPAAAPAPRANSRSPVSARVLDAVLTDNLSNSLMYLHEQGGVVVSEHDIPGSSQAVAKLLSLRLARADDRGIYLTDAGRDIASLLISVNR